MVGCAEMDVVFYLFATSFVLCLFFVLSKPLHVKFSSDTVVGVQKFHQGSVPRIGGLAVFASLCIGVIFLDLPKQATSLVLASLPVFVFGLVEDLFKSVSSLYRLVASFATSVLFIILSGVYFTSVDIFLFDELFDVLFLWPIVTVIALSALMNSVNIIDGFNGLASGSSLLMTLALAVLAYQSGDAEILEICLCFSAVIFGFFLVNFPKGMLFLGDAGAYVLGFFLGGISIYLVEFNQEVTPLVLLVVFAYPIVELLFSFYRKSVRVGHRPDRPDKVHLHMLVYRKYGRRFAVKFLSRNSITGATLLLMPLSGLVVVSLITVTRAGALLYFIVFVFIYLRLYRRLSLNG
jgi:UDP-N-acetylmuramyl pentapeptide phosphotransferase/UDP-N-acetylglucosamine-1-phosphate transferase